jgi:hypothetical protein
MVTSEQLTLYTVVWGTGLLLGWPTWRNTRFPYNRRAQWVIRSLFLALIVAPGVIRAHGTFVVPAAYFLILFVAELISGHLRTDVLLHALQSIIPTWATIYALIALLRYFRKRASMDA